MTKPCSGIQSGCIVDNVYTCQLGQDSTEPMKNTILVAGATGDLGGRIVKALLAKGTDVIALVRASSKEEKVQGLASAGATIRKVENWTVEEIAKASQDVSCVVSVLAGLREVVIDAQKILVDGAVAAGVPRFIPSDYSLDFTKFS